MQFIENPWGAQPPCIFFEGRSLELPFDKTKESCGGCAPRTPCIFLRGLRLRPLKLLRFISEQACSKINFQVRVGVVVE